MSPILLAITHLVLALVAPASPSDTAEAKLSADEIKRVQRDGREVVIAAGNVAVAVNGTELRAPEAEWDPDAGTIRLIGTTTLTSHLPTERTTARRLPRGLSETILVTVTGKDAVYNINKQSGSVRDARTVVQELNIRGSQITVSGGEVLVQNAVITTCDLDRPHYAIRATQAHVIPGTKAVIRGASLTLGGTKLLGLAQLNVNLRRDRTTSGLPLPRLGRSRLSGYYLRWFFPFPVGHDTSADVSLDLASKAGFRGSALVRGDSLFTPFLRVATKEELLGRRPKRVLVTRAPEAGFLLDRGALGGSLRALQAEASIGWFREHTTGARTSRLSLNVQVGEPARASVGRWRGALIGGVRVAHYGTGEDYRDISASLTAARLIGKSDSLEIGIAKHFLSGRTPFIFDEAYLPVELNQRIELRRGLYSFEVGTRFDLDEGKLFDVRLGVGRAYHCLEPRLVWRGRLRELSLEVRLVPEPQSYRSDAAPKHVE
ncbi:MAG: hypothetical protein ACUVTZ_05200 [Armatimonadota bacterium]